MTQIRMCLVDFKLLWKINVKMSNAIVPIVNDTNEAKNDEWTSFANALLIVVWIGGAHPKIKPTINHIYKFE